MSERTQKHPDIKNVRNNKLEQLPDPAKRNLLKAIPGAYFATNFPFALFAKPQSNVDRKFDYELVAQPATFNLGSQKNVGGLTYNSQYPAPVLEAQQGKKFRVKIINKLDKATTIHWHGVRIDNKMDGVPYLTQEPIHPGESFVYEFVPPDAGTFWYHPHINSVEQLSQGLTGILIVRENKPVEYKHDMLFQLKNWNIHNNAAKNLFSLKKAARCGTMGTHFSINGKSTESIECAAGESLRLRFANLDSTMFYELKGLKKLNLAVIAIDGVPVAKSRYLDEYSLGPGMRVDLGTVAELGQNNQILTHQHEGKIIPLLEFNVANTTQNLTPPNKNQSPAAAQAPLLPPALPANPIIHADLNKASTLNFVFEWSAGISPKKHSMKTPSFWAINRIPWEGVMKGSMPKPLATLKLGGHYIFKLENRTPNRHPIHLHGLFFRVESSNQKKIDPFYADTVILEKNEKVTISFVATNPGNWMFHCHIIEHMKTGFMGYISVS